jgi:hypothetical protein
MQPRARTTAIILEEVDGEFLLYDLERDRAHCLKDAIAAVWRHADGKTPIDILIARVRQDSTQEISDDVVWGALETLSEVHLLVEPIKRRPHLTVVRSRRT